MLYSLAYNDKLLIVKVPDSTDPIVLIDSDARVPITGHAIVILYTMTIVIATKDSDARIPITGYAIDIPYTMTATMAIKIPMAEFLSQAMPSTSPKR